MEGPRDGNGRPDAETGEGGAEEWQARRTAGHPLVLSVALRLLELQTSAMLRRDVPGVGGSPCQPDADTILLARPAWKCISVAARLLGGVVSIIPPVTDGLDAICHATSQLLEKAASQAGDASSRGEHRY